MGSTSLHNSPHSDRITTSPLQVKLVAGMDAVREREADAELTVEARLQYIERRLSALEAARGIAAQPEAPVPPGWAYDDGEAGEQEPQRRRRRIASAAVEYALGNRDGIVRVAGLCDVLVAQGVLSRATPRGNWNMALRMLRRSPKFERLAPGYFQLIETGGK